MANTFKIPIELLEQFERGNVLLFVGEGINRGILPSAAELAEALAARCDYPAEEPLTLARVAGYYELTRDRQGLIQFLRDRLERPGVTLPRAHKLAARLRPPVIVTTCYDRLLERALREANVAHVPVVGNAEVAYADKEKVLLVWLWGVLDQPDAIIVTEDDRRGFLKGRVNLSDMLRGELARRTWLFVGFDAEDAWFRGFYDSVNQGLDRQSRRAYLFGAPPGAYTRAWWEHRNAEILNAEVESFLAALTEQLAARAYPTPTPRPVAPIDEPLPLPEEPYKALVAYEARDRALFFGRDREIEELTALIHAQRLALLYGASGVGKTSLLQAGVIPRLTGADPGYTVINVRALTDPAVAIRAAVRRALPEADLPTGEHALVDFLAAAARAIDRPLVIVIDQFEEFFIRLSPEFRAAFIAELGALHEARDLPIKVVLSMREDYLARVSEIEQRIPEVFQSKLRLLPLTREQACEAIVRPVEALGYTYAPELSDQLLDDLTREGVMPPQLQLVCGALFHHARAEGRRMLTLADYETLGEAQGVLRGYLDEELRRFLPEEQALARDLLEELVTSERTKKVETVTEMATALAAEPKVLRAVVEKLVRARLLRPVAQDETQAATAYELAHEYLIAEITPSAETVARKEAEELLRQGVDNWQRFEALLSIEAFALINAQRERLRMDAEAQELMLRSALRNGRAVGYWLARMDDQAWALALAEETLLELEGETARQSLRETAEEVEKREPERLDALTNALRTRWRQAKGLARACAADALWALRDYLPHWFRIRLGLPRLARLMALPGTGALIGALMIALIFWGLPIIYPRPYINWVNVYAGEFQMGSTEGSDDERPVHTVALDTFRISKYEITNAQYAKCVRATACDEPKGFQAYSTPNYANHPVIYVSWFDARDFCQWLGGRLPTEAEWEYAARGGYKSQGYLYAGSDNPNDVAWYNENASSDTHPVGLKTPNEIGLYDMSGNVWEWVADWYRNYPSQSQTNPTGAKDDDKIVRGGAFGSYPSRLRTAGRYGSTPGYRNGSIGFRCAAAVPGR